MVQFKYRCVKLLTATSSAYVNVHINMEDVFLTCNFSQLYRALKPLLS